MTKMIAIFFIIYFIGVIISIPLVVYFDCLIYNKKDVEITVADLLISCTSWVLVGYVLLLLIGMIPAIIPYDKVIFKIKNKTKGE